MSNSAGLSRSPSLSECDDGMTSSGSLARRPAVAHVIPTLAAGGAESLLVTNLRHLDHSLFRHVVVVAAERGTALYAGADFWSSRLQELSIPVHSRGLRSLIGALSDVVPFARWLRRNEISIVHSHLMLASLLATASARVAGVRSVRTLHSVSYEPEVLATYSDPASSKHQIARHLEMLSLRATDSVVAVSETVARSAARQLHVDRRRMQVIYNPVDAMLPDRDARSRIRREIGIEDSTPLVVTVGRVIPSKRQAFLARVMQRVRQIVPTAHLAVVGGLVDAACEAEVRRTIQATGGNGSVTMVGARHDVPAWLAAADVFAFPSAFEGLPVALAEAATAGCACVASAIPSNAEVIVDETMGRLHGLDDLAGFAGSISALLGDAQLRERIGHRARLHAQERFDPKRSAQRLERIYSRLA